MYRNHGIFDHVLLDHPFRQPVDFFFQTSFPALAYVLIDFSHSTGSSSRAKALEPPATSSAAHAIATKEGFGRGTFGKERTGNQSEQPTSRSSSLQLDEFPALTKTKLIYQPILIFFSQVLVHRTSV
uniref:Uncharacterized protein n=1 Tax=Rhodosorus marinus TaxID=101924 RepID=A0A7S3EH39_9RHOD